MILISLCSQGFSWMIRVQNEPIETVKRILPTRPIDEQKSILRSELHNENLDKVNKPSQVDENSTNGAPNLKVRSSYFHGEKKPHAETISLQEKLNNLQRSLHDLSNRYSRTNQEEVIEDPIDLQCVSFYRADRLLVHDE